MNENTSELMEHEDASNSILLTEKIPKLCFKFILPALIAMLITGVQGMIDGIFVGNILGANAMASVNIAIPYIQSIIGISMVICIGAQSHIGLKLGLNSVKEAQDTFQSFFRIIIACAVFLMTIGVVFNEEIAKLIGANEVLLSNTATYIRVFAIFAIPTVLMFYFGFLNRIIGKPELFFKSAVLSLCINIILDYLLIVQFELGMVGAAFATGISYASGLVVVIWPMLNKENIINVFKGRFDRKCIAPVLYNGSSEGINSISIALTAYLFNMTLMKLAGEGGVAAFTAINYIGVFGSLILFGVSDGIGPIVSYNYGHGGINRVKKVMRIAYTLNFMVGIVIFCILYFGGESLVSIFIKDNPEIVNIATHGAKLYGIAFFMSGFNILNSGYFTFIGRGLESVLVAASRGCIFTTIGILVLPMFLGIDGVWLCVPFAECIAMMLGGYLLMKGVRHEISGRKVV